MNFRSALRPVGIAAVLLAGLSLSVSAFAQDRDGPRGPRMDLGEMFEQFDTDGDGSISREEAEAARTARIAELDADGDGFISRDEFLTYRSDQAARRAAQRAGEMFDRMDADKDGRLSAAETMMGASGAGGMSMMFDRMDADGDGVISRAEADAWGDRMSHRAERRMMGDAKREGRSMHRDGHSHRGDGGRMRD